MILRSERRGWDIVTIPLNASSGGMHSLLHFSTLLESDPASRSTSSPLTPLSPARLERAIAGSSYHLEAGCCTLE